MPGLAWYLLHNPYVTLIQCFTLHSNKSKAKTDISEGRAGGQNGERTPNLGPTAAPVHWLAPSVQD